MRTQLAEKIDDILIEFKMPRSQIIFARRKIVDMFLDLHNILDRKLVEKFGKKYDFKLYMLFREIFNK